MSSKFSEILIAGADESNHGDKNKIELVVVTFSTNYWDSVVGKFSLKRNYSDLAHFISKGGDFRYKALISEKYSHNGSNLCEITPEIIMGYMDEEDLYTKVVKVYLDGTIRNKGRDNIRNSLLDFRGITKVIVDNFEKKHMQENGHLSKCFYCPTVIPRADAIAHDLSHLSLEEHLKNKKFLGIK